MDTLVRLLSVFNSKGRYANPSIPLHFERYGTAPYDPANYFGVHELLEKERELTLTDSDVGAEHDVSSVTEFRTEEHLTAQQLVLKAYNYAYSNPAEATRIALESLEIKPTCDAYSLLAISQAQNYEEALELYRKGQKIGPDMTTQFETYKKARKMFLLSGYFRCVHGEANTLRKMGRLEEAVKVYQKLIQLDPNRYPFRSCANYQTNMPELYQKVGKWKEADSMLKNDPELVRMDSSKVCCLWSKALCDYVLRKGQPSFITSDESVNIVSAVLHAPFVLFFMTGKIPLPNIPIPTTFTYNIDDKQERSTQASVAHQATYASHNKTLWECIPGALEWAERTYNTLKCFRVFRPHLFVNAYDVEQEPNTVETIEKYVSSDVGIFVDKVFISDAMTLMHEAVVYNEPRIVKLFIEKGVTVEPKGPMRSPVQMACFLNSKPEIIELLMDHGADVINKGNAKITALQATVRYGHWSVLHTIFKKKPTLKKNAKLLTSLVEELFDSDIYECQRGGAKCKRCLKEPCKHEGASLEQCLKQLFMYGFKPSSEMSLLRPTQYTAMLYEVFLSLAENPPVYTTEVECSYPPPPVLGGNCVVM
jgi:tetratricopeptide (TPR) repeat protein